MAEQKNINFDQASVLRGLVGGKKQTKINSRVITITSGKGGVGKTNFTANLAINLSKLGKRVVIMDADFGLANIELVLGIIPKYSLANVLRNEKTIEEVITLGPNGIKFISGGSGLSELANLSQAQMNKLIENLQYLDSISDIILIDTGAGISKTVVNFIIASSESIIITTPEPTSVTDAYSLIKTIKHECKARNEMNVNNGSIGNNGEEIKIPDFKIVVNRIEDKNEGEEIFEKLSRVCKKFLGIELNYIVGIMRDENVTKAVKKQVPVCEMFPKSNFSQSVSYAAKRILLTNENINVLEKGNGGIIMFMKRLVGISS